ncbi:MAG: hypothetical protein PWP38_2939 [Clostridiales bacterium]|nr:hypothetical protein [Clostridiales bacterium]
MAALSGIHQIGTANQTNQVNEKNAETAQKKESMTDANTSLRSASIPSASIPKASNAVTSTAVDGESTVTVLSDGDLLELSAKGVSMVMTMAASDGTTENASETETLVSATASKTQENNQRTIATVSASDDEDDDTSDLSNYSEYELSQMLSEGTISVGAYNAEIKKRQQVEQQLDQANVQNGIEVDRIMSE